MAVDPHRQAMGVLAQIVALQQAQRRRQRGLVLSCCLLPSHQA